MTPSLRFPRALRAPVVALALVAGGAAMGMTGALTPQPAAAQTKPVAPTSINGAHQFLNQLIAEGRSVLSDKGLTADQKRARIREISRNNFHMEALARFSLGDHVSTLSAAQLESYYDLYFDYMAYTYFDHLVDFDRYNFAILKADRYGKTDVLVETLGHDEKGAKLPVNWRVRDYGPGSKEGWRIIDIVAKGVSIALTQRKDFSSVLGNKGFEGLVTALESKIAKARKRNQEAEAKSPT